MGKRGPLRDSVPPRPMSGLLQQPASPGGRLLGAELFLEDALVDAVHQGERLPQVVEDLRPAPAGVVGNPAEDLLERLLAGLHPLADLELAEIVAELARGLEDAVL